MPCKLSNTIRGGGSTADAAVLSGTMFALAPCLHVHHARTCTMLALAALHGGGPQLAHLRRQERIAELHHARVAALHDKWPCPLIRLLELGGSERRRLVVAQLPVGKRQEWQSHVGARAYSGETLGSASLERVHKPGGKTTLALLCFCNCKCLREYVQFSTLFTP